MDKIIFMRDIFYQPYFDSLLAIIACIFFYYLKSEKKTYRKIIWISYSSIFAFALVLFIGTAINRIYHPQIWDFGCFYLYGKVAASGHNFYLPEDLHLVFNTLNLPFSNYEDWVEEVVNVGFVYPPPTMLYFITFGFLSYKTGLIIWTIFNFIFVLGSLYLIYNMFFKEYKLNGLLLVSILFFIFLPSISTVEFSQTNFILLFLLLLIKKYSDKKISGLFLALAIFTKPYMIIFGIFFLLRMKWKAIFYCIISATIIMGITLVLFGKEQFISYMFNNPTQRIPGWAFSESINQSVHAVLLRSNLITLNNPIVYFYIIAGILTLGAGYLVYLLKRQLYDYIWPVLLLVALIIYPGTLSHYAVLLLFIIFQFFDQKKQLGFHLFLSIPIIAIFYYLSTFSVFASICFLLSVLILKSLKTFFPVSFVAVKT